MHFAFAQSQLHNLTLLMDKVKRSPGCLGNAARPNTLMNAEALHPGEHSASRESLFIIIIMIIIIIIVLPVRDSAREELPR